MDDSFSIPSEGLLISQILGVKTSLCFRPRRLTQKPHAVLRRVEASDDSSDEGGESSSLVHFKIFAQKRFTITPGKEILLTVDDARFKDHSVLFCGAPLTSDELEMQERVKAAKEGDIPPLPKNALPPKMRRAWVKKTDDGPVTTRTSVGIQATPTSCSVQVQAKPHHRTVSVQSHPSSTSVSVQTLNSTRSVFVQAETSPYLSIDTSMQQHARVKERSLSPMDLDSPDSDSQPSSAGIPVSEPFTSLPPGCPLPSPLIPDNSPDSMVNDEDGIRIYPHIISSQLLTAAKSVQSIDDSLQAQSSSSIPSSPFKSILPNYSDVRSRDLKEVSRTSPIYNPFVSAGFVTEFTGETLATTQIEHIKESMSNLPDSAKHAEACNLVMEQSAFEGKSAAETSVEPSPILESKNALDLSVEPQASTDTTSSVFKVKEEGNENDSIVMEAHSGSRAVSEKETKFIKSEAAPHFVQHKTIPTGPRNAVASSSKVMLEHAKSIPNAPRAPRSLRNKVDEPAPTANSLAILSSGPYTNPLSIKPSTLIPAPSAPSGPKTLAGVQTKKRVLIGIGTPMSKATSEIYSNPPAAFRSQLVPKMPNLVAYSSPSPPPATPVPPASAPPANSPKPPPPPPVQIKWKRLPSIDTTSPSVNGSLLERISPSNTRAPNLPLSEESAPSLFSRLNSPNKSPTSPALRKNQSNGHLFDTSLESKRSPIISKFTTTPGTPTPRPSSPNLPTQTPQNTRSSVPSQERRTDSTSTSTYASATNSKSTSTSLSTPWNAATLINPVKLPALSGTFPVDTASVPQTFHPLPPKPVAATLPRGVKRERASSPNVNGPLDSMRSQKRVFRWPTLESNHSMLLRGEGDLAILGITGTLDGTLLALICADKTIRIWNNNTRTEMARLSHNARVASVLWLEDDSGIISLGEDGMISRWSRTSFNHWTWAKMVDIGVQPNYQEIDSGMRLAYYKDKVAVSLPSVGVKVWFWSKGAGSWQAQRPILRPNVTALTFIEDGSTLLGGTVDGVLWACEVPNGIIRACAFLKTKISSIDVNPSKTNALITCHGVSRLIGLQAEQRGRLEQSYTNKDTESNPHQLRSFGACFIARGQGVLFGDIKGCALIWDTKKGSLVYGLDHGLRTEERGEGEVVTAAVSLEAPNGGCIVTGTNSGLLSWWSQPAYANSDSNKKAKVS
ncbi:hypothetical protein C8J55DRAFT_532102 [Lentinula edodes]|uniref:WD40 repeat-like protein n=1 Tax=Lentinula lateritia TaxID=40482 RepID=A0A9W9DCF1_9AGAR|nr:hypothetical protein C8J55DRAFT_532102 [Lentinula edodes]